MTIDPSYLRVPPQEVLHAFAHAGAEILRYGAHRRTSWMAQKMASKLAATERDLPRRAATLMERTVDAKK